MLKPITTIKLLALVFIAYWLSNWAYLPPFAPEPDLASLTAGLPDEVVKGISRELKVNNAIEFVVIIVGTVVGLLLYKCHRFGRALAISMCTLITGLHLFLWFSLPHPIERFLVFYKHFPIKVIHHGLFGGLLMVVTLLVLMRGSIRHEFNAKSG